jgi:prolipoprotein diacylglyceryltransferase
MKAMFIITTPEHSFLYSVFYVAAFLVTGGIFVFAGIKRKYPASTWLLITLSGVLFFIIGNKLITLNLADWQQLKNGNGLHETGRSVLGGILGLIVGLSLAKRWLRFNLPVFDNLAYALPIGMAITRLGCLFAGCCHGIPADLPWALQYGNDFTAFYIHQANGLIPHNSALSLPVHPTQLYDLLFCLTISLLVYITRKTWKASGSRFIFVILSYGIFRFVNEFFREPFFQGNLGETFSGIKIIQWLLLGAVLILALLLFYRETGIRARSIPSESMHQLNLHREFILFSTAPLFITLTYRQLAPFEMLTLCFFVLLIFMVFLFNIYGRVITPQLRWSLPLVLLFSFITMSQVRVDQPEKVAGAGSKGWLSVNAFGSAGSYPDKQYDCEGNVTKIVKRNYSTLGTGVSYHYKPNPNQHLTVSSNFYSDRDFSNEPDETDYRTTAVNLLVNFNSKNAGGTLGITYNGGIQSELNEFTPLIGAWVGQRDIIFAEVTLLNDYYLIGAPGAFQMGVGSGFGEMDHNTGRVGVSYMPGIWGDDYVLGGYLSGDFLVKNRITLKPGIFFGKYVGGSLGIQVHLGNDRWKSKALPRNKL